MTSSEKISIYVDGSCEENKNVTSQTPAGWGFCVVIGDTGLGKGQGEIIIEKSGKVITENKSIEDVGQEIFDLIIRVASGEKSKSEYQGLGDLEFVPWQIGATM